LKTEELNRALIKAQARTATDRSRIARAIFKCGVVALVVATCFTGVAILASYGPHGITSIGFLLPVGFASIFWALTIGFVLTGLLVNGSGELSSAEAAQLLALIEASEPSQDDANRGYQRG
jgi:hypothetical protein